MLNHLNRRYRTYTPGLGDQQITHYGRGKFRRIQHSAFLSDRSSRVADIDRAIYTRYCHEVSLLRHRSEPYAVPTARYVLELYVALPLNYINLVERPYRNDIHPPVFSVMSYDRDRSPPIPSTLGLSYDIETNTGLWSDELQK